MKIITALDNPKLIRELKKDKNNEIIGKDLQYREAILEILDQIKKIDIIILNEKIPGKINLENLLEKIKYKNNKIRIIIILKNKKEICNKKNKNVEYYYEKQIENNRINMIIKSKRTQIQQLYYNNNSIKTNNLFYKYRAKKRNKQNIKHSKIINIFGYGESKNIIIILLLSYLIYKNKKILLININNKIDKLYLLYKNNKKEYKNKNFYIIPNLKKELEKIKEKNFKHTKFYYDKIINFYNGKYDYILVDKIIDNNNYLNKQILKKSSNNIIVIEENLLSIQGLQEFIQKIKNKYFFKATGLHIIKNKSYFTSINSKIIKNIIHIFNNIYYISYSKDYYNLLSIFFNNERIKLNYKTKNVFSKIIK